MGDKTLIEWADATWNPIRAKNRKTGAIGWHCTHVSDGCRNCYAETWNMRLGTKFDYKPGHIAELSIFLDPVGIEQPLHWKRPRRIFVCSMSDLFANFVETAWIVRVFEIAQRTPQHAYQVLTKRADRMCAFMNTFYGNVPKNVWLGVSVEDQTAADERIPLLLQTPGAKRFLSCEPLLGPIDLKGWCHAGWDGDIRKAKPAASVDWVIAGGESGRNARPMHPDWVCSLRDQCAAGKVPFFFKQWGEWAPGECAPSPPKRTETGAFLFDGKWLTERVTPRVSAETHADDAPDVYRLGKKHAGRLLDGREHNEFPS